MTIRQTPTLEEFLSWPDQKPYLEYLHGRVQEKAMPDASHSYLQLKLGRAIDVWADHAGGYVLTEQRCALSAAGESFVALPDVAYFASDVLPQLPQGTVRVPPTLAIEILSPGDRYGNIQDKVTSYLNAGVPLVWVVDPPTRKVTVYRPKHTPEVVSQDCLLSDPSLPGLSISLADLFARLPVSDQPPLSE